jgi:hypothetical protein
MSDTLAVPSAEALELAALSKATLVQRMRQGRRPDPEALAGWEYLGVNTARFLRAAGGDRFVKGFQRGGYGYNRRVGRGSRTDPWLPPGQPDPPPFAFYSVAAVDPTARDNRYLNALLLDYGAYAASALDPAGRIRDYLVALDDAHDRLLGHAFVAVGRARVAATFFVIERFREQATPVPAPEVR